MQLGMMRKPRTRKQNEFEDGTTLEVWEASRFGQKHLRAPDSVAQLWGLSGAQRRSGEENEMIEIIEWTARVLLAWLLIAIIGACLWSLHATREHDERERERRKRR